MTIVIPVDVFWVAVGCLLAGIGLLWFEMRTIAYRDGCHECNVALVRVLTDKVKSAGQKESDQRKPPGADGGGWAV